MRQIKKTTFLSVVTIVLMTVSCNKEKSLMKRLTTNWKIEKSEIAILSEGGEDNVIESVENAGKLTVYDEDPDNPSKDSKLYDFYVLDVNGDTWYQNMAEH